MCAEQIDSAKVGISLPEEKFNTIMQQLCQLKNENDELRSFIRHKDRCSLNTSGGLLAQ